MLKDEPLPGTQFETLVSSATIAKEYLREASNTVQALNHDVSAVSGIWISSDDAQVLSTVRHEAPKYFPGINQDLILSISFEPVEGEKVITRTRHMVSADALASLSVDVMPTFSLLDARDCTSSGLICVIPSLIFM